MLTKVTKAKMKINCKCFYSLTSLPSCTAATCLAVHDSFHLFPCVFFFLFLRGKPTQRKVGGKSVRFFSSFFLAPFLRSLGVSAFLT